MRGGKREGAGRPKKEGPRKVRVTVTLEPDVVTELDALDGNRSSHVERAVRQYLEGTR
jgi:metal-responsive CopG/Arc/MetJ family transcriptional regulator